MRRTIAFFLPNSDFRGAFCGNNPNQHSSDSKLLTTYDEITGEYVILCVSETSNFKFLMWAANQRVLNKVKAKIDDELMVYSFEESNLLCHHYKNDDGKSFSMYALSNPVEGGRKKIDEVKKQLPEYFL